MQSIVDSVKGAIYGKEEGLKDGFSFMVDISGSVGGSAHYWDMVGELVALYGQKVK